MQNFEKSLDELGDLELGNVDDINPDEILVWDPDIPSEMVNGEDIQEALGGVTKYVDIVFCIDVTASMVPIINTAKALTLNFYDDFFRAMPLSKQTLEKPSVKQLRVKVIAFRDYYCDGPYAMEESDFFELPKQKNEFRNFVASLEAKGGGDEPENALEAMALAMKSDWVRVTNPNTEKARNVVVIFTDASAHPLEKSVDGVSEYYPADMLKNYNELYDAWCGSDSWCGQRPLMDYNESYAMNKNAERLVIFAPEDAYPWSDMAEEIDYVAVVPVSEGGGCAELNRDLILEVLCNCC